MMGLNYRPPFLDCAPIAALCAGSSAFAPGALLAFDFANSNYRVGDATGSDPLTLTGSPVAYERTGAKSEINSDGSISAFATDVPGITDEGYWSREEVTNIFPYSGDFAANWTVSANAAPVDDYGETGVTRLIDSNGGGTATVAVNYLLTVATSTVYTISLIAKEDQVQYLCIRTGAFGASSDGFSYFNLNTGAVAVEDANHTASIEAMEDGYYRCSVTFTSDASVTNGRVYAYATEGTGGTVSDIDGTTSILLKEGATMVEGPIPGPIIATSGATATVSADDMEVTLPSALTDTDMLIFASAEVNHPGDNRSIFDINDGTTDERIVLSYNNSDEAQTFVTSTVGGGTEYNDSLSVTEGEEYTIILTRVSGDWRGGLYNGSTITWFSAATAGDMPTGMDEISIGHNLNVAANLNGYIPKAGIIPGTFDTDQKVIDAITDWTVPA